MENGNNINQKPLFKYVRTVHVIFLVSIPILLLLVLLLNSGTNAIFDIGKSNLIVPEILFSVISILILIIGFTWPKLEKWRRFKSNPERILVGQLFRIAQFESIGVYGFVMGIVGSIWFIWIIFMIVAFISLIFIFPTNSRIARWCE
jgi:hypothetical protein